MVKSAKLKIVDSYHDIFTTLTDCLKDKATGLAEKNLVFLEEKVSLMTERRICSALGGTFNTEVFSFGKFLRAKNPCDKMLNKEGSSMVLRRIINDLDLKCFSQSKPHLASSLYDLLILLKSASLSVADVISASEHTDGVLKNKLIDIAVIFDAYEKFIKENDFIDQSSALSLLPEIIKKDEGIKSSNVYLVGYAGWTKQAREIVSAILSSAKSVTAILPGGENKHLFVGETEDMFRRLCKENGVSVIEDRIKSSRSAEGEIIADTVFSPLSYKDRKETTDKIWLSTPSTVYEEVESVAHTIKASVMQKGLRYSDVVVALPNVKEYADTIKTVFENLDIPCFIDDEKTVANHPLIRLITDYLECARKNFERTSLMAFVKNPLFTDDRKFADRFENYLIKYNINFDKIKDQFSEPDTDLDKANALREKIITALGFANVKKMLDYLDVKEKLILLSQHLLDLSRPEEASINDQIYDAVEGILDQMQIILGSTRLTLKEQKDVFTGGVEALKLSIIPQYADAVFVGGYKEVALSRSKYTFMLGLTSAVPNTREDVAILTDGELERLENVKVLVEPKISIINKRELECIGLALSVFSDRLLLSYPLTSGDGTGMVKSEIISYLESLFTVKKYKYKNDYLTAKQSLINFAKECGEFASGKTSDVVKATAFYNAVNENTDFLGEDTPVPDKVLDYANAELKRRLDGKVAVISDGVVSPTAIEKYYTCPYKSFLSRTLRINRRDDGEVSPVSVGNIAHAILQYFVYNIEKNPDLSEEDAFKTAVEKILEKSEFRRYQSDVEENETFLRAVEESRIYCHKLYEKSKKSGFRTVGFESKFGDGAKYPAISLHGGKYKISGKIDRVDEYGDYFRVIDYKTGGYDVSESALFTGTALQLYLYSLAVQGKDGKKPAGMYYFPIDEGFKTDDKKDQDGDIIVSGRTLDDLDVIKAQDADFALYNKAMGVTVYKNGKISGASSLGTIDAHLSYALKMCENATEQMADGVICPSPITGACKACDFKGMCKFRDAFERSVGVVKEDVINGAMTKKGDEDND